MFLTQSIAQLKAYCEQNAIAVEGDKRKKTTWLAAIALFQSAVEVVEETLVELFAQADAIGTKYQDPEEVVSAAIELAQLTKEILGKAAETTKTIAFKAFEVATSDKAIELYRKTAYLAAMAVLLVVCAVIAIGRTILESEMVQAAIESVQVKAVEFMESVKLRSAEFWTWLRSKFDRMFQESILGMVYMGYHGW